MTPDLEKEAVKAAEFFLGTGVAEDMNATYTVSEVKKCNVNAFLAGVRWALKRVEEEREKT